MTTYGLKGGKGLDKLGENQQMQINWGDVRNIRSIDSIGYSYIQYNSLGANTMLQKVIQSLIDCF